MYIVDPSEQIRLIGEMTQLRKDMEKWEVYYHHPFTNQMWKSFFPKATDNDRGPKLLRHEPLPGDLREYLLVCLTEDAPENAIGAGIEQSVQIGNWPKIMRILEQDRTRYDRSQFRLFLEHLRLEKYRQNLTELGLTVDDLPFTEKELKRLKWRAKKLKFKKVFG